MKFASKLLLTFLSFIIAASGGVVYTIYYTTLGDLKDQIRDKLEEQATSSLDKIDRMLFERYADIKVLSADPVIASMDSTPVEITKRLLSYRNAYKTYASLSFFDLERVRIADTSGMHLGRKHDPVRWSRDVFDNDRISVAEDIRLAEELKAITVYFAAPVKDKEGKTFAAVVARMPIERLYEAVAMAGGIHTDERENLRIDLVDRDGFLLYSSYSRKGILKGYGRDWESIKKGMGTRNFGVLEDVSIPGKISMVSVFAREQGHLDFEGNGWTLLLHIPEKTAFAPVAKLRNRVLIIFGAVSFFSLFAIGFISRAISRPLVALKDAALEAGKGNFEARIETASHDEVGQLALAFNSMAKSLKESYGKINTQNKFLKDILESISHPFYVVDVRDYSIVESNSAANRAQGILKCFALAHGEDGPCKGPLQICPLEEMRKTKKPVTVEHVHYDRDKNQRTMEIHAYPLLNEAGELAYMIEYALDITKRKRAQEELKKINKDLEATQNASLNIMADLDRQRKELDKSLQEKEALIREVHHRVKNNMQVISSLLKLQSYHIEDPALKAIFKDSENRIKSMALVHERLYRTEDLAHINFGDYIKNLAVDIFHSFGAKASHVRLHVDAEDISLPIDTAIPCGLISNELITNALKYAFPGGQAQDVSGDRKAELVVEMKRREQEKPSLATGHWSIELVVRDNGVGMPEGLDFKTAPSLGLNLITSLAKQIRGEIELNREGGTEWRIKFGEKSY